MDGPYALMRLDIYSGKLNEAVASIDMRNADMNVPSQPLLFSAITAICFVLAFTAEAFYHRLTGEEIPIKVGRSMLVAVAIVFLALAVRGFMGNP